MQSINGNVFDIARSALYAAQQGMSITSQNIANANTPGYSRRRLVLTANAPYMGPTGYISTGVSTGEAISIRDQFLNNRILSETQDLNRWETSGYAAQRLQSVFGESSDYGLNTLMSEFWNGWQEVSNSPLGYAERSVLLENGSAMADQFRRMYEETAAIRRDLDSRVRLSVSEVNRLASETADLNSKIGQLEAGGQTANDFRDMRDIVLKELSELIDITVIEDEEGMASVSLANGLPLVSKGISWSIETGANSEGYADLFWDDTAAPSNNITNSIRSGELKGLIEARDTTIPDFTQMLNDLAGEIINQVNALHQAGDDLNGDPGGVFFEGSDASDIALGVFNWEEIAAAETGAGSGNNKNALEIAGLAEEMVMAGNKSTFASYLSGIVSDAGNHALQTERNYNYRKDILNQLENYRESVSGVSIDEEMINLVQYQHAYSAASKLISVSDQMLQTLMDAV